MPKGKRSIRSIYEETSGRNFITRLLEVVPVGTTCHDALEIVNKELGQYGKSMSELTLKNTVRRALEKNEIDNTCFISSWPDEKAPGTGRKRGGYRKTQRQKIEEATGEDFFDWLTSVCPPGADIESATETANKELERYGISISSLVLRKEIMDELERIHTVPEILELLSKHPVSV